jgi:hypothetical protein
MADEPSTSLPFDSATAACAPCFPKTTLPITASLRVLAITAREADSVRLLVFSIEHAE